MFRADLGIVGDCKPSALRAVKVVAWAMNVAAALLMIAALCGVLPLHLLSGAFFCTVLFCSVASFTRSTCDAYCRELGRSSFCRVSETTLKAFPKSHRSVITLAGICGEIFWVPLCLASAALPNMRDSSIGVVAASIMHPTPTTLDFNLRSGVSGLLLTAVALRMCIAPFAQPPPTLRLTDVGLVFDGAVAFLGVPLVTNLLSAIPCDGPRLRYEAAVQCGSGQHLVGVSLLMLCLALYGAAQDVAIHKGWILVDSEDTPRARAPRIDRLHLHSCHLVRISAAACANSGYDVNVFMFLVVVLVHHLALVLKVLPSSIDLLNHMFLGSALANALLTPLGLLVVVLAGTDATVFTELYGAAYFLSILLAVAFVTKKNGGCSFFADHEEIFVDDVSIVL